MYSSASFSTFTQVSLSCVVHLRFLVLMLADKYNVIDLRELCLSYMREHCTSVAEQCRVVDWLQYAKCAGYKQFVRECQDFILRNFQQVAVCDGFLLT
jgi:hypothetical protein